jgi:hypothetical protein
MDNSCKGLLTSAMANVKTGLAVCLAELEHQKLMNTVDQILGPVVKRY